MEPNNSSELNDADLQGIRSPPPLLTSVKRGDLPAKGGIERPNFQDRESASSSETDEGSVSSVMDSREAYRRRKAQLRAERAQGKPARQGSRKPRGKQHGGKHSPDFSGDEQGSEYSVSTSEDVELGSLHSDETQSDDEETGLTKGERSRRKGRRKRALDPDVRIAGKPQRSKLRQRVADRTVLKTLFLNSLLVASWYLFSLSISIVSHANSRKIKALLTAFDSTINGCSHQSTWTFIFRFSQPVYTCLCNSVLRLWSSTLYRVSGRDWNNRMVRRLPRLPSEK